MTPPRPVGRFVISKEPVARPVAPIYCVYAAAVTKLEQRWLRWEARPSALGASEVLLLLAPATLDCAFVGGAGSPRVVRVDHAGDDVIVHVGFGEPYSFSFHGTGTIVPRPTPAGQLRLVVHGSIMAPPGRWDQTTEVSLTIDGIP
jgi:hypothetical protein